MKTRRSAGPASAESSPSETACWIGLIVAFIGVLWTLNLRSSLWLDETVTYWIVKDGLSHAVDRAIRYQGQSPLYFAISWLALNAGGVSELSLRLPSFIAVGAAAFLLYRLGRRLIDKETGVLATVVFCANNYVVFAASDARPYAFGLLAVVAGATALARWLDRGRPADGAIYVACATLIAYFHYLFALVWIAHAVYLLWPRREGAAVGRRGIALAGVAVAALSIPLVPQFLSLLQRRGTLVFPYDLPVAWGVFLTVGPTAVSISILAISASSRSRLRERSAALAFLASWCMAPPLVLLLVSLTTPSKLFHPRYFLSAVPGIALLMGWALRSVSSARLRVIAVAAMTVVPAVFLVWRGPSSEDWRAAIRAVRALPAQGDRLVMVRGGLVESKQLGWLDHPERKSYLLSPLSFYPVDGEILALPWDLQNGATEYLEGIVRKSLAGRNQVVLVSRFRTPVIPWFEERLGPLGFRARDIGRFGSVCVVLFQRAGSGTHRADRGDPSFPRIAVDPVSAPARRRGCTPWPS